MWVWPLGQKDPLEKGMAIHSRILAWEIPWIEKPSELQSVGSHRVRQDWSEWAWTRFIIKYLLLTNLCNCVILELHFCRFSSDQLLSHIRLFVTPWAAACQASLSITNSWSLLRLMPIELVMPSSHPLSSPSPTFNLAQHQGLSNESALHIRWTKYWSFSFNVSPSNEYSGLISFRMDWLDLLAVQGTLKSLLQNCNSKASILQCSAFFIVQLSHSHMTTGKAIGLTRWTFVGKVMSLLFNMLSSEWTPGVGDGQGDLACCD